MRTVSILVTTRGLLNLLSPSQKKNFYFLIFFMIIGASLEIMSAGIVMPVLAFLNKPEVFSRYYAFINPLVSFFNLENNDQVAVFLIIGMIFIYFAKSLFLAFLSYKQASFSYGSQSELAYKLFNGFLNQPITFHMQRNSSQLLNTILNETVVFRDTLLLTTIFFSEVLVVLGMAALILFIAPTTAITIFIFVFIFAYLYQTISQRYIIGFARTREKHDEEKTLHLQQGLTCIREIKLLNNMNEFLLRFKNPNKESSKAGMYYTTLTQCSRLWLELLCIVILGFFLIYTKIKGLSLSEMLPVLGMFLAIVFRVIPSANRILGALHGIVYGLPSIDKLSQELSSDATNINNEYISNRKPVEFNDELRLDNVSYTYPGTTTLALKNISLTIKKGSSIGIIGASGSGKSTLLDIILGLLKPDSGEVLCDGRDIYSSIKSWHKAVGYIQQNIVMTDDTIERNIAFGESDEVIDIERIWEILKRLQLDAWVNTLPQKLKTRVGESGAFMSGGQRQRLAIARALYRRCPVLILDEPTSALDKDAENEVMRAIEKIKQNTTVIMVSHKTSILSTFDKVFKIEQGSVLEISLISQKGLS